MRKIILIALVAFLTVNVWGQDSIDFNNTERVDHTDTDGLLYYDLNFYSNYPAFTGANGGGLSIYNSEDGWGGIIATNNMQWLTPTFDNGIFNGNVGIGTANPIYGRLQVTQSTDASDQGIAVLNSTGERAMRLWTNASNSYVFSGNTGAGKLILNSTGDVIIGTTGKVGIGTTSPTSNIHISSSSNPQFQIRSQYTGLRGLWITVDDDNSVVSFNSSYNNSGAYPITFKLGAKEKVRITETGKVGIGTDSPQRALHIVSSDDPKIYIEGLSTADPTVNFRMNEIQYGVIGWDIADNVMKLKYGSTMTGAKGINIDINNNIGIGTTDPGSFKLAVEGKIGAHEIVVTMDGWADFVFESNYDLMPLKELETYIQENKHLPEIPTTAEVKKNGISVGEMNAKLLQKVEELTLYVIELQMKNEEQDKIIVELQNK